DLVSTVADVLAVPLGRVALCALLPPASGLAGQVVAVGAQRERPPDFWHPLARLPRPVLALLWQRPPRISAVARAAMQQDLVVRRHGSPPLLGLGQHVDRDANPFRDRVAPIRQTPGQRLVAEP